MRIFGDPERTKGWLKTAGMKEGEVIESKMLSRQIERAQRKVEAYNFDLRKNLLEYDDVANDQRKVIYQQRTELMAAEDISDSVTGIRAEVVNGLIDQFVPPESPEEEWKLPELAEAIERDFQTTVDPKAWLEADHDINEAGLRDRIVKAVEDSYTAKVEAVGAPVMRHLEKAVMLQELDRHWREHLAAMDYLRQGIHLRAYAQKNPKQEYKREAFELFGTLLDRIKHDTVSLLSRLQVKSEAEIEEQERERERQLARRLQMQHTSPQSATTAKQEPLLPRGVTLPKGVALPNDTALAIYLPLAELKSRTYLPNLGLWIEAGQAFEESRGEVARKLFPQVVPVVPDGPDSPYGLLLTVHPVWEFRAGVLKLQLNYRVLDPAGASLHEGSQVQSINAAANPGGAFRAVIYKAMQLVLVDVLKQLQPSAAKYPPSGSLATLSLDLLANKDKPISTGTGFYINDTGQMLTAAHVVRDCLLVEAQKDGVKLPVKVRAESALLDLAVVDSGVPTQAALPLRVGQTMQLGESLTNVGYPLSGLLATTPNLTRGNVSARGGLKGSAGLFQFSAPIQPGASSGPVVSDGGELLGVTVSTLNVSALVTKGLLPQNVNFALDARHAAAFLRREQIGFAEVPERADGSMQQANDAALAAVVQLSCYQ
jgi:S1-C subfamily serine protease